MRPEDRTTSPRETGMGGSNQPRDPGVGSEPADRNPDELNPNRERDRSSGKMEGDENLNRR